MNALNHQCSFQRVRAAIDPPYREKTAMASDCKRRVGQALARSHQHFSRHWWDRATLVPPYMLEKIAMTNDSS
jgi:hypothetical protein